MKKTLIIVCLAALTIGMFSSCLMKSKPHMQEGELIAVFLEKDGRVAMQVNEDAYKNELKDRLAEEFGAVEIETLRVVDNKPFDKAYNACLEVVFYSVDSNTTTRMATLLQKEVKDGITEYRDNSNGDEQQQVCCTSSDCGESECAIEYDKHGMPTDCTNCSKHCSKLITAETHHSRGWSTNGSSKK